MPSRPMTYPISIERDYTRILRRVFTAAHEVVRQGIAPVIVMAPRADGVSIAMSDAMEEAWMSAPLTPMETNGPTRCDVDDVPPEPAQLSVDAIKAQIRWIRKSVRDLIDEEWLKEQLEKLASKLDGSTLQQIGKSLGIDLYADDPALAALIDSWVVDNVAVINATLLETVEGAVRKALVDDISHHVIDAWSRGLLADELAKVVEARLEVSMNRARFISRDQISTLNGAVVQHRQKQAGITRYRWSTSRDERVRKDHRRLNNTVQSWDSPPDVGGGRHEHPGGDYLCRCTATPIMPDWMSQ